MEGCGDVIGAGPIGNPFLVGDDHSHTCVLEGVTVEEGLLDHSGQRHDLLDLLRSDVLSLRELEDVLGTVNNLDRSIREDHADISRQEPAIISEGLCGLIWSLEVASEDGGSLHANFAARVGLVRAQVVHLRQVLQTEFNGLNGATDVTRDGIILIHKARTGT